MKPAYLKMLDLLTDPIDTFTFDELSFGGECLESDAVECQRCEGACRWSYPFGDYDRDRSRQAKCRCETEIEYA